MEHVEATLDPSRESTRKISSMSELVAEMVLGAFDEDDASAADAAALAAARAIAIAPTLEPPAEIAIPIDVDVAVEVDRGADLEREVAIDPEIAAFARRARPRARIVATLGALVLVGCAVATFVTLR